MRVALDATPLIEPSGGIRRYVTELYRALCECFPEDQFCLISDQLQPPASWIERRWWLIGVQREMTRRGAEIFHGTDFSVPYLPLRPSVMTLHDLSPWRDPAWHGEAGRVRRRTPFLLRLGLATMAITHSQAIRQEAMDRFRLPASRVVVIPLAAPPQLHRTAPPEGGYFLYVGTLEPRKNLPALIEAWRLVRRSHSVRLILAGRKRADGPKIQPEEGLEILGMVEEERLADLYSGALACVYPSLYEGFGLPVLEAMQCGAAVLASKDPAISELAQGAAELIEAGDIRAWAEAMNKAIRSPQWVADLRRRSVERAREFSWQRTARATYEVYKEAQSRFDY